MAIQWGPVEYGTWGGNPGLKVGVEVVNMSVPTADSTTFTCQANLYTYNVSAFSGDEQGIRGNGLNTDIPLTEYTNNGPISTAVLRVANFPFSYNYLSWGPGSGGGFSISAELSGVSGGASPSVVSSWTMPYRPFAVPPPPTNVTATRDSDAQVTISTAQAPTAKSPVDSMTIQMKEGSGAYTTIYTGTGTSYVKTGLSANRIYSFQVRLNNSVGSSAYVPALEPVYMTPSAPTGAAASMVNTNQLKIEWTNTAYFSSTITHKVERSINGGAWTSLIEVTQATLSWIDPSPGAGTNQYRVATRTTSGPLISDWALSNLITAQVPPLAPSSLAPDGLAVDVSLGLTLTWTHRHGGDGAPQTAYRLRYSTNSGVDWTVLADNVASAVPQHAVAAGVLSNGFTYLWQVQTQGIAAQGYGPYSASATITGANNPALTLDVLAVTNTPPVSASWVYTQAQGHPQTGWEAELSSEGVLLEGRSGGGSETTTDFTYPMVDGQTYTIRVRVRSSDNLLSPWASADTTIDILAPAGVRLGGAYDECTGSMQVSVVPLAWESGVTAPTERVEVYRRILPDTAWNPVALDLPGSAPIVFTDPIPSTTGVNEYRATAYSSIGMADVSPIIAISGTDGARSAGLWVFVNHGAGFGEVLRFHNDPQVAASTGRNRSAAPFRSRQWPFALLGKQLHREVSVSGLLNHGEKCGPPEPGDCSLDSHRDLWEEAALESGVVCFRDWTGRRIFGILSDLDMGTVEGALSMSSIGFGVTEVDWDESAVEQPTAPAEALVLRIPKSWSVVER